MTPEERDRLNEEVKFHVEQQTSKYVRGGMMPADARRAALIRFGGAEAFKERARDQRRGAGLLRVARDLRMAMRLLARAPGFSATVVLTLAIGIGAASALFGVIDGVLIRPLIYPQSDRIVRLFEVNDGARANTSELNILDWRARTHAFSAIGEVGSTNPSLVPVVGGTEPEQVPLSEVSRDFFDVMATAPQIGRRFNERELHPGSDPVAIVSDAYWRRALGSRPLGDLTLRIDSSAYRVVGVMPAGFDMPAGTSIWTPREQDPPLTDPRTRGLHNFAAYARLAPGTSLATAQREISDTARAMKRDYGDEAGMADAIAVPILDHLTASSRPALVGLFGAALLLLLVAITNVSNLLLARTAARRHEFAVLTALGASPMRLARQLLGENLVLCLLGGVAGLLFAGWAIRLIPAMATNLAPRFAEVHINWSVLAFAMATSTGAAMLLAIVAVASATGHQPASVLADAPRTTTSGRRALLGREALVVAQVSLTLVLLTGAALLAVSLTRLLSVDTGFRVDETLVADVAGPWAGDASGRLRQVSFQERLIQQVGALHGVTHAGFTTAFPYGGGRYSNGQFFEINSPDEVVTADDARLLTINGRAGDAGFRVVSEDYFNAMGIPLLFGRLFDRDDRREGSPVAIISQALAREHWKGRDPLGHYLELDRMDGDSRGARIVGVVGDVRELQLQTPGRALVYVLSRQRPATASSFSLIVRGDSADALGPAVRRIIHSLAPDAPVALRTVRGAVENSVGGQKLALVVAGLFGASALVLATLGLYGLVAFVVTQRRKEIGIRMALGATASAMIALMLRRALALSLVGVAIGLVAARLATTLLQGLIFAISPSDPVVLATVAVLTIAVTTFASLIPALRAARVRPAATLRAS